MHSEKLLVPGVAILAAAMLMCCSTTQPGSQSGTSSNAAPPQTGAAPAASAPAAAPTPAPAPPVELASGTAFSVRIDQALSTQANQPGDGFTATLEAPVRAQGQEILPAGTKFNGKVTEADASGRLQGRAVLGISLDSFELNGQKYPIKTSMDTKTSEAHKKRNIEIIGGGTGLGALIGGIAGGGKGAAIGAVAGAGAGTAGAAATGKLNVEVPAETVFRFSLKQPVSIQM